MYPRPRRRLSLFETFRRNNKKLIKRAKWAIIAGAVMDVATLGAGYYFYHQMRNSRDFRFKVYNYDPRYIDLYYRANEKYGDGKARQNDYQEWGVQKVDSFGFVHILGL